MTKNKKITEKELPLSEHIRELRRRLYICVIFIIIAFAACYYFSPYIFNWVLSPYTNSVLNTQNAEIIYTSPQESFLSHIKLSFYMAIMLASPVVGSQIYLFIAPGLFRHEKNSFLPYVIATPILFLIGILLVHFFIMPTAMKFFLSFQQVGDVYKPQIKYLGKISEYLDLAITLSFSFGLCFQLPVILTLLARINLINSKMLVAKRKISIVIAFIAAAILTPPDPLSQISLAIPIILLYELSIFCIRVVERRRKGHSLPYSVIDE